MEKGKKGWNGRGEGNMKKWAKKRREGNRGICNYKEYKIYIYIQKEKFQKLICTNSLLIKDHYLYSHLVAVH